MKTAWELGGYWELEITFIHCIYMCVCVCVCSRANQVLLCIYASLRSLSPLRTLIATLVRVVFDIAEHETMGYKLAFQPDIFDMISASHLVSLLFVSFLP